MMSEDVLINFVLDASGSMAYVADATCDGFNQFLEEQKKVEGGGRAFMSLTLFDTRFDVRHVGADINEIPPLTHFNYRPGGSTALYDAVGTTIKGAERWVAKQKFTGKVITAILTDGQENASRKWHIYNPLRENDPWDVNGLIQWKQNEGWDFVFLGAGHSAWLEGTNFAIPQHMVYNFTNDSLSHQATYGMVSSSLANTRTTGESYSSSFIAEQKKKR